MHIMNDYLWPEASTDAIFEWASRMLRYVYSDVTLLAYVGANMEVLDYILYDTEFGQDALYMTKIPDYTEEILLLSNHPEGRKTLSEGDQKSIHILSREHLPLRVFVLCDAECIEFV